MSDSADLALANRSKLKAVSDCRGTAMWWQIVGTSMGWANLILGVSAVICSALVAGKPGDLETNKAAVTWLATGAAIATGTLGFLNARDRGTRYLRAQNHLADMLARFDVDPTIVVNDVLRARREASDHVSDGKPLPKTP